MALYEKYLWNSDTNTWELVETPISSVTGLQGVLDGKAPLTHSHNELYNLDGDTRSTPTLPTDYNNVLKISGYKDSAAVGRNGSLMGINGYTDQSGGVLELSWNNGRFSFRTAKNSTEWNSWGEVASEQWVTANTRSNVWVPSWSEVTGKPSVVIEGDTRLTNARPASDVHPWAKAENKPTYDLDQISDGTTYKRVTQSEKTKIEDYLSTFNAANKLLRLNQHGNVSLSGSIGASSFHGDIWTDYISSDSDFINIGAGISKVEINTYEFAVKGVSGGIFLEDAPFVDVGGAKIINLGTPTAITDAATKGYVDGLIGGGGGLKFVKLEVNSTVNTYTLPAAYRNFKLITIKFYDKAVTIETTVTFLNQSYTNFVFGDSMFGDGINPSVNPVGYLNYNASTGLLTATDLQYSNHPIIREIGVLY